MEKYDSDTHTERVKSLCELILYENNHKYNDIGCEVELEYYNNLGHRRVIREIDFFGIYNNNDIDLYEYKCNDTSKGYQKAKIQLREQKKYLEPFFNVKHMFYVSGKNFKIKEIKPRL